MEITNPTAFPAGETHCFIDGPAGQLELITFAAKESATGVAVICHPHPLHQGTMHNKVVYTLSRAFNHQGLHTVRFNYRGVGASKGEYGNSIGEIADLMAVLAWVDKVLWQPPLWLAGFSFGAYIAARGATQHACRQLITIAPAVTNQDFAQLPLMDCPWTVIQGEQDEIISPIVVTQWFEAHSQRQAGMQLLKIPPASHFFHGQLTTLRTLVQENIS